MLLILRAVQSLCLHKEETYFDLFFESRFYLNLVVFYVLYISIQHV